MACHIGNGIIVCCSNVYKFPYKGRDFYFEWHNYLGPIPVRKMDLELRKTVPAGFWDAVTEFSNLSKDNRNRFLIRD